MRIFTNKLRLRCYGVLIATASILSTAVSGAQEAEESADGDETPPEADAPAANGSGPDEGTVNAELIIVQGAAGEEGYEEDFAASVELWQEAGEEGMARVKVIRPESDAQREKLKDTLASTEQDSPVPLWIILVGHGTFDRRTANFNLEGPDVSALDLGEWLEEFKRPLIVVHGGAASAPFIRRLSREGRVIITATRSGTEINYARFGTFMARALQTPEADLNNDGQTSVYECFLHAARQTKAFYETNGLLATEHALIDDNGDGRGSGLELLERFALDSQRIVDGDYARLWSLVLNEDERKLTPDQRRRRNAIERKVIELRRQRAEFSEEEKFYAEAKTLLLEIAQIYEENENTPAPEEADGSGPEPEVESNSGDGEDVESKQEVEPELEAVAEEGEAETEEETADPEKDKADADPQPEGDSGDSNIEP